MTQRHLFGPEADHRPAARPTPTPTSEPFAKLPWRVIRAKISPAAKLVYAILRDQARASDTCQPAQSFLCALVGCSRQHLRSLIGELETANLIAVRRTGFARPNSYCLLPPSEAGTPVAHGNKPAHHDGNKPAHHDGNKPAHHDGNKPAHQIEEDYLRRQIAAEDAAAAAAVNIEPLTALGISPEQAKTWTALQPLLSPQEAADCFRRACADKRRRGRPEPPAAAFLAGLFRDPLKFNFTMQAGRLVEARPARPVTPKADVLPDLVSPAEWKKVIGRLVADFRALPRRNATDGTTHPARPGPRTPMEGGPGRATQEEGP